MAKRKIAVMDIGSSEIRTFVLHAKSKSKFDILGKGIESYAGFINGEFLEPEKLKDALRNSIIKAKKASKYNFKELYVGIGGEFLIVKSNTAETTFVERKKVTQYDLDFLIEKGDTLAKNDNYTLISCNPIEFLADDDKSFLNVIGIKTKYIKAHLSYQYADSSLINSLNEFFKEIGLNAVNYISAPQSELKFLLEDSAKKENAIIVDCGYISTYVISGKNNGVLTLNSFSIGGGHIMGDLAKIVKIDYLQAEELKRKAILTLNDDSQDGYEVTLKGQQFEVPATLVGEIIKDRLDMICQLIEKSIEKSQINYPKYFPIFLTGGGVSMIKGAKTYMQQKLGRPVEVLCSTNVMLSKANEAQISSLCQFAVEKELEFSCCFLAKLFRK